LTLSGGTLNYLGAGNAASLETVGNLALAAGNSVIQTTAGASGSAVLTFGTLTRFVGGALTFAAGNGQTLGTATNQILFTTAPALTNAIIKGAITNDATSIAGTNTTGINLATYGAGGVTALTAYTALPVSGSSATTNYIATTSTALSASETVNALLIVGDNIGLTGAFTLTSTTNEVVAVDNGSNGNNFSSTTVLGFG